MLSHCHSYASCVSNLNNNNDSNSNNYSQAFQQPCCLITGGVRIPLEELLQQPNRELAFPLYDRTKQEAGTIQVPNSPFRQSPTSVILILVILMSSSLLPGTSALGTAWPAWTPEHRHTAALKAR